MTYLSALRGLFPGRQFSEPVDMQGTQADKFGVDVLLVEDRSGNSGAAAEPIFVDNKVRSTEKGQDVFFEAFHVFFKRQSAIPFEDRSGQQLLGKKVFFLLAEAFNKIPLAHRNLPEVFSAVNSVLTNHGESFRVEPGWGLSSKLVSDVILSSYPSGAAQAYRKDQVQKALVMDLAEGLRDRRLKMLSPSVTRTRDGQSAFMTFNTAIEIQWLSEKRVKVLSLPAINDNSVVMKYAGLSSQERNRIDTLVTLKLKNKGLLRSDRITGNEKMSPALDTR